MHYFVCLRVLGLYALALQEADPKLATTPVCVHRTKSILDVNAQASARGVHRGMPLGEARSILPEGHFRKWDPEPYRGIQRRWLDHLCTFVNEIEPDFEHEAFADLTGHPDPVAMAIRARGYLTKQLGLEVQLGMGPSKWMARSLCGVAPAGMLEIVLREAVRSPGTAICDLPVNRLPVLRETSERLRFLGYTQIGRVREVPLEQLLRQFGEEGHVVYQACRGGWIDTLHPSYPDRSMAEGVAPEGGIQDLASLEECLRLLAKQLGSRLQSEDFFGKHLSLAIELESGVVQVRKRVFVKPLKCERTAWFAMKTMLESPPEEPIVRIQARLLELERIRRIQADLSGATDRREREISAASAFCHLRKVLGDECVKVGSELEEPRRVKVLRAWRDATGWR